MQTTMETHPIETRHLKIFVSVYELRSFTKAAKYLFTSQPTISEHMQNLEAKLNCKLFDRMGRTILPTVEADLLYPRAVDILQELQKLQDDLQATTKEVAGNLMIGASTIPGTYILPKLAAAFKQKHPAISFEIAINQSEKIIESVAQNRLYIGMVGAIVPNSKLQYIKYREDQLILAASADLPVDSSITFDQLCKLPFISREIGSGTRKSTELLLNKHNLGVKNLNVSATLGSSAAVKEAIKANLGVSIISSYTMQEEITNGNIKRIDVEGLELKRFFYLVTPTGRTFPKAYETFISYITKDQQA